MLDAPKNKEWFNRVEDKVSELVHRTAVCGIVLQDILDAEIPAEAFEAYKNYTVLLLTPLQRCALDSAHNDLLTAAEDVHGLLNPRDD